MSVPVNDSTTLGELKARAKFKRGDLLNHRACPPELILRYVVLDVVFTTSGEAAYVCRWVSPDPPDALVVQSGILLEHELELYPFPSNWVKDKRKEGQ